MEESDKSKSDDRSRGIFNMAYDMSTIDTYTSYVLYTGLYFTFEELHGCMDSYRLSDVIQGM